MTYGEFYKKVMDGLECCSHGVNKCAICSYDPQYNKINEINARSCMTQLAMDALELLKAQEPVEPRLLAAEEVQHLPDKTVICVEQLLSREAEERGYITGMAWGIVCNRTNAPDGGLILSMLGTFFPNTVREIPYKATYRDENTKKRRTAVYRFWTDRPTDEQWKATPWPELPKEG